MAQTVTVELTTEQVDKLVADGSVVYPEKTPTELRDMVAEAAKHVGIFTLAETWALTVYRQQADVGKAAAKAAHEALFPPTDVFDQ